MNGGKRSQSVLLCAALREILPTKPTLGFLFETIQKNPNWQDRL